MINDGVLNSRAIGNMFKPANVVCFWAGLCDVKVLTVLTVKINIFWVVTWCF
jgi:hypothetical protein